MTDRGASEPSERSKDTERSHRSERSKDGERSERSERGKDADRSHRTERDRHTDRAGQAESEDRAASSRSGSHRSERPDEAKPRPRDDAAASNGSDATNGAA